MDPLETRVAGSILPSSCCLHGLPHGSFEKMREDPIKICHLRKPGPFLIGSQLAMVTIVLYPRHCKN
uniref:Uncharacterized protein n=1 Tax=Arundo donax TaxID=35708 RepID=A0A0A9HNJ6_ARUDO